MGFVTPSRRPEESFPEFLTWVDQISMPLFVMHERFSVVDNQVKQVGYAFRNDSDLICVPS